MTRRHNPSGRGKPEAEMRDKHCHRLAEDREPAQPDRRIDAQAPRFAAEINVEIIGHKMMFLERCFAMIPAFAPILEHGGTAKVHHLFRGRAVSLFLCRTARVAGARWKAL